MMGGSRREFLATTGKLGVGAAALAAGLKLPLRHDAASADPARVRTIHLETREVTWELTPGKTVKAMAYNGQVPGPLIRARAGERLRVVLKNALDEPTTIHWHGVDVPNRMDGVPGITQEPVAPGASFVYEFEARPAGTRWYHTHFKEHRQMDLGLAAPFIIEPTGAEKIVYDREVTLVLDDWATGRGPAVPDTGAGTAGGRGGMGGMMTGMMRGGMGGMMGGPGGMMGRGMNGSPGRDKDSGEPVYDTMTINGRAYPATEPLHLKSGERVRLRLVNASSEHTHVVRLAGHRLAVSHTDGNPLTSPVEVDALPIAPAERYDVIVHATRPGAWFLHCTQPGHVEAGERMLVAYAGHETKTPPEPERDVTNLALWQYGLGNGRPVLPAAKGAIRPSRSR